MFEMFVYVLQVDLVFEAFDKGFWAAVKNFMDSTKIPIILTSNDSSLPQKFDGRFEQYKFRVPPMVRNKEVFLFYAASYMYSIYA